MSWFKAKELVFYSCKGQGKISDQIIEFEIRISVDIKLKGLNKANKGSSLQIDDGGSASSGGRSLGHGSNDGRSRLLHDTCEETFILIALFSDSEEDGDESAVAMLSDNVTTDTDNLGDSGLHVGLEVSVMKLLVRGRHENVDILSNNVDEGESEELLSGLVETIDETDVIDDDGRHGEVVENFTLHLDERLLLSLIASLLHDTNKVETVASRLLSELKMDWNDGSVFLNSDNVASFADNARNSSLQVVTQISVVVGPRVFGRQDVNVSANHLGLRVSQDTLDSLVDILHNTIFSNNDNGIKDEFEHTKHIGDQLRVGLTVFGGLMMGGGFLASTVASRRSSEILGVMQ